VASSRKPWEAVAKDAKNRAEMEKGRETMRPFFNLA
jgi:hypothetical protein